MAVVIIVLVVVVVVVVAAATAVEAAAVATKDQCNTAEQAGTWSWGSRAHSTHRCMTKLTVMFQ